MVKLYGFVIYQVFSHGVPDKPKSEKAQPNHARSLSVLPFSMPANYHLFPSNTRRLQISHHRGDTFMMVTKLPLVLRPTGGARFECATLAPTNLSVKNSLYGFPAKSPVIRGQRNQTG